MQLLKTSVRVFFVERNGTKNVSRTIFNTIFLQSSIKVKPQGIQPKID
jgi:hypothetical protein